MLVALVATVSGATAVATAAWTAELTAVLLPGAVAKVTVNRTVACKVLPVCKRWRLPGRGAGAAATALMGVTTAVTGILPFVTLARACCRSAATSAT